MVVAPHRLAAAMMAVPAMATAMIMPARTGGGGRSGQAGDGKRAGGYDSKQTHP